MLLLLPPPKSNLCVWALPFAVCLSASKELACPSSLSVKASLTNGPGLIRVVLTKIEAPSLNLQKLSTRRYLVDQGASQLVDSLRSSGPGALSTRLQRGKDAPIFRGDRDCPTQFVSHQTQQDPVDTRPTGPPAPIRKFANSQIPTCRWKQNLRHQPLPLDPPCRIGIDLLSSNASIPPPPFFFPPSDRSTSPHLRPAQYRPDCLPVSQRANTSSHFAPCVSSSLA